MTDPEPPDHDPAEPPIDAEGGSGALVGLSPTEAAIADAVALLSGPGLDRPDEPLDPEEVEATWGHEARASVESLATGLGDRRVGLAISGGGSLGSFEAGALRFLYDHLRVAPVAICGNSAGALNAAKLAEGPGDAGDRPIEAVERVWRSLRVNGDMWEPEPWVVRLMASASWASSIRGHITGAANGAEVNAVRVAMRVMGTLVRRPPETDGTFEALRDAFEAQSLLSLGPVAQIVARELDPAKVAASGVALRIGTVALESGELRYVTETGHLHDRADQPLGLDPVPLVDGILASASIPVAFPPVLLGDEHYVDGGAREILPLELLVEHLDVDRVFAVSASTATISRSESFADRNMLDILRRVSAEIATNETLRKELSPPRGWGEDVSVVVPDIDVHDAMTIDPALIAISIDYGWLRAADVLLGLGEQARTLSTELTRTRVALRELAGPLPTLFGRNEPPPHPDPSTWVDGEATLTARLREQVQARVDLGLPVPPTLAHWLAST
ncbi:MAG: patatin-like phospholipase family protein [Acidimicrobiales bacterium]